MQLSSVKKITWFLFAAYILLLIKLILFKNPERFLSSLMHLGKDEIARGERNIIFIPFKTTWSCISGERGLWDAIANIGGNLLGFVPMAMMLPILFNQLNNAKKVISVVFLTSLFFEMIQFFTGVGYCDIDDIIQNTLGGVIGWLIYKKWISKK